MEASPSAWPLPNVYTHLLMVIIAPIAIVKIQPRGNAARPVHRKTIEEFITLKTILQEKFLIPGFMHKIRRVAGRLAAPEKTTSPRPPAEKISA